MNRTAEVLLGALATALLCTIWMFFANHTGLLGWGGFAGCTAYFAAPKKGLRSLPVLLACVASGMLYAFGCLYLGKYFPDETIGLASTCIITFLMCAGGKYRLLTFVPGAFIGSFSSFAAGGDPWSSPPFWPGSCWDWPAIPPADGCAESLLRSVLLILDILPRLCRVFP